MTEQAIIVDIPQVYDVVSDKMRRATQMDVDLLTAVARTYWLVSQAVRKGDLKEAQALVDEHHERRSAA